MQHEYESRNCITAKNVYSITILRGCVTFTDKCYAKWNPMNKITGWKNWSKVKMEIHIKSMCGVILLSLVRLFLSAIFEGKRDFLLPFPRLCNNRRHLQQRRL